MATFSSSGPISAKAIRDFVNNTSTVAATNISIHNLFTTANSAGVFTLPNGNFTVPHAFSEWYSAEDFDPSTRIAIGALWNDNGTATPRSYAGHVRVFEWNGSSWSQLGSDIDGNPTGNVVNYTLGTDVALSADGNTLIVSGAEGVNSQNAGYVHIYDWNGSSWNQRGSTLVGTIHTMSGNLGTVDDQLGLSVSISADGDTIVIIAPRTVHNVLKMKTEIYDWSGTAWTQRGSDILADANFDGMYGPYTGAVAVGDVALSSDGNVVATGYPGHQVGNTYSQWDGQVKVHVWNASSSTWVQRGANLENPLHANTDYYSSLYGDAISLNGDGTILVIGTWGVTSNVVNTPTLYNRGMVEVFQWNATTSTWNQMGSTIFGAGSTTSSGGGDNFGHDVSLSDDGLTMAASAPGHDSNKGTVRVYYWSGTAWVQKGSDIDGEFGVSTSNPTGDRSGTSIMLSPNGHSIIIGATWNNGSAGVNSGHARIFDWNGTNWVQRGNDIDGEYSYDLAGYSVAFARA